MGKQKLSLFILLVCLFVFIIIAFLFSGFLGGVVQSSRCVDSDGGINVYVKGSVSLCVDDNCTIEAEDVCDADYVTEYYCTNFGNTASKFSKCTFGCLDGECLHIGEREKIAEAEKAAENETESEEITEEQIKEIICEEGWQCEGNTRGFQGADCAWIKEEYCKYGCTSGECTMPGWWDRFVFWIKENFS